MVAVREEATVLVFLELRQADGTFLEVGLGVVGVDEGGKELEKRRVEGRLRVGGGSREE